MTKHFYYPLLIHWWHFHTICTKWCHPQPYLISAPRFYTFLISLWYRTFDIISSIGWETFSFFPFCKNPYFWTWSRPNTGHYYLRVGWLNHAQLKKFILIHLRFFRFQGKINPPEFHSVVFSNTSISRMFPILNIHFIHFLCNGIIFHWYFSQPFHILCCNNR